jgi:hypothetical protein
MTTLFMHRFLSLFFMVGQNLSCEFIKIVGSGFPEFINTMQGQFEQSNDFFSSYSRTLRKNTNYVFIVFEQKILNKVNVKLAYKLRAYLQIGQT